MLFIYLNDLFFGCYSLKILPDISKWNTNNVINMGYMFSGCSSLLSLPNISKWKVDQIISMSCIFSECSSLISLPDLSKWFNEKNEKLIKNEKYMKEKLLRNINMCLKKTFKRKYWKESFIFIL